MPGAEEADLGVGVGVARRERRELVEDLGLREPVGELERAVEAQLGGDVGEQLVDRLDADRVEHRRAVGVGCGRVAAHRPEASERARVGAQPIASSSRYAADVEQRVGLGRVARACTLTSQPSP